jgi:nitrite reductase/ring-hydroxylating ferredoxin subunit
MMIRRGRNVKGNTREGLKKGRGKHSLSGRKACPWHARKIAILQGKEHEKHQHRQSQEQCQIIQVKTYDYAQNPGPLCQSDE